MLGRTPAEAYRQLIDPIQSALNTITVGRLFLARKQGGLIAEVPLNVSMNGGALAPLQRSDGAPFFVKVDFRVLIDPMTFGQQRFQCRQIAYWYAFYDSAGAEIVAYHWTPDILPPERPYPHLHIGNVIGSPSPLLARDFHKLHLPTSQIAVQQIVRFAIQELEISVRPGLRQNLVLAQLEDSMRGA